VKVPTIAGCSVAGMFSMMPSATNDKAQFSNEDISKPVLVVGFSAGPK
jgi:hypothetical protein